MGDGALNLHSINKCIDRFFPTYIERLAAITVTSPVEDGKRKIGMD